MIIQMGKLEKKCPELFGLPVLTNKTVIKGMSICVCPPNLLSAEC